MDVDIMINHLTLQDEGYRNMSRILQKSGYKEHPEKIISFVKTVMVDGVRDLGRNAGNKGGETIIQGKPIEVVRNVESSWNNIIN